MVNKKRLISLTQRLLRIKSENPPGEEYEIAMEVKKELGSLGLEVKTYSFLEKRPNVVGILKAESARCSLLLTPHLDTVPAGGGWKYNPYSAKIIKGKIYGRGATDCKGNLSSCLEAIRSLVEDGIKLNYNLIFAATADEEASSKYGIIPLLKRILLRPDFALILDASSFDIIVAQKGLIHFKINISGKKAHGAYPWLGVNAIEIASRIINDLKRLKFKYKAHKLLRGPTINIGTIVGGDKVNMVADFCEFSVDLRFLPGMSRDKILKEIKNIILRYAGKFKIEIESMQDPYEINKDNPLVRGLIKAAKNIKAKSRLKGSEGATVITFFKKMNIPAIATGFGAKGTSHATDEYARIDDLYRGARVLVEFLKNFNNACI
ncbi:MAG: M20 family metallopeptidase [Candidatus Omnitrophota bacterium]